MAHRYYVPVAPHAVTSPIGMMATAHVAAAIPSFLAQEWHWIDLLDFWRNCENWPVKRAPEPEKRLRRRRGRDLQPPAPDQPRYGVTVAVNR